MSVRIKQNRPPRGVARLFWRLPIWLYRLHLGWLLQQHFLLLTHTGRKSGLPRKTMLEVIHYEREKQQYTAFSGWGTQADWVKNVEKTPRVIIQVGRRSFRAQAVRASTEEAENILLGYAHKYPSFLIRPFFRLLGYRIDGTEDSLRAMARQSTIITFQVISACASGRA